MLADARAGVTEGAGRAGLRVLTVRCKGEGKEREVCREAAGAGEERKEERRGGEERRGHAREGAATRVHLLSTNDSSGSQPLLLLWRA
eukprot:3872124-Rhodomonas_salina.1